MKKINKLKLVIPALIIFAAILSFTTSSSSVSKNATTPSVIFTVANIEDTLTDAEAAAELQLLYDFLETAGNEFSTEFLENFYPAVVYTVRAVVVATRALTRNTPVIQQLTPTLAQVIGNVLFNLLFFDSASSGIEEKVFENNLEEYKIYCLQ